MKKESYGCLLVIALFWCGLTGAFLGVVLVGIFRQVDAQRRFLVAPGTVLESRVETSRGSKGSTLYRPRIRYRYAVGGKEFTSDRYTFDTTSSSSGQDFSRQIVDDHPRGKEIPVYYDPDRPEVAILELRIPGSLWFMLLFLQPFLIISVGILWGLAKFFPNRRRIERFLASAPSFPWEIPSWGMLKSSDGALSIEYRPSRVASIGAVYCLTSFIVAIVGAITFRGFYDPPEGAVAASFGAAFLLALAGGWRVASTGRRQVRIDPVTRTLEVEGGKETRMVSLKEIEELRVHRPMVRSKGGPRPGCPRLSAFLRGGGEMKLHEFAGGSGEEVAVKAGKVLAGTAGVPFREGGSGLDVRGDRPA